MQGKARTMNVKVTGIESVTTSAGTFEAYKVEMTPTDGDAGGIKLWIRKDDRVGVKSEVKLPAQMGGATAVSELTK
jgi:hypothetical protein